MIVKNDVKYLKSILALYNSLDSNVSKNDSIRSIADNVVNITGRSKRNFYSGAGLMITTDGFILTAYHVLSTFLHNWKKLNNEQIYLDKLTRESRIEDKFGGTYPLDITVCFFDKSHDLALIKAVKDDEPSPIEFNIRKTRLRKQDIRLYSFKDDDAFNQLGKVISFHDSIKHSRGKPTLETFLTDAYGIQGFSGGVFIDSRGALAGIHTYISDYEREIGYAGGVGSNHIIKLVRKSAYELSRKKDILILK